uniref:Uncharacterized protein n=1 Tax=Anguilla anguilla TaxID=7936 RepID=A0A0E9SEN1_ANGAN
MEKGGACIRGKQKWKGSEKRGKRGGR